MNKQFVPYEEAIALKELGFDELCLAYYQKSSVIGDDTILPLTIRKEASNYNDNSFSKLGVPFYSAPLYQQAFRWFREKGIYGDLTSDLSDNLEDRVFVYYIYSDTGCYFVDRSKEYKTYEMAELACLKELIEIVKQNKDEKL